MVFLLAAAAVPLFSPGLPEILVICFVVVLLFGATKLPKLGKGIGEGIRSLKDGLKGGAAEDDGTDGKSSPPKTDSSDKS